MKVQANKVTVSFFTCLRALVTAAMTSKSKQIEMRFMNELQKLNVRRSERHVCSSPNSVCSLQVEADNEKFEMIRLR